MSHMCSGTLWFECYTTHGVQRPRMMGALSLGTRWSSSAQMSLSLTQVSSLCQPLLRCRWVQRERAHGGDPAQGIDHRVGTAPPISVTHCGNHIQNLIDVIVTAACDASLSPVLPSGAAFYKVGRSFLRLLHTRDRTLPCSPLAKALGDEDYANRNFKGFTDAQHCEAWSSDSEQEEADVADGATGGSTMRCSFGCVDKLGPILGPSSMARCGGMRSTVSDSTTWRCEVTMICRSVPPRYKPSLPE